MGEVDILDEARPWCAIESTDILEPLRWLKIKAMRDGVAKFVNMYARKPSEFPREDTEKLLAWAKKVRR